LKLQFCWNSFSEGSSYCGERKIPERILELVQFLSS
jgi:hypothetical protein